MRERTDHALLLAAARGDEAAFAILVARHRPRLVRYATSRCGRDAALAEDAVQDGLVRAHRAIVAGKVPVDVEAWLYAIVRNRCHDYFRAARPTSPLPPELPGGAPSALEVVEQGERLAGALGAVERLPSAQRTALVGRELEGRSYEELARRQATTVPAVKSLLHRARTALAHQASMPAFVAPVIARLARVRPGQIVLGMVAEHASGAAAIATIALAGTSALGSLHLPGPARRPDRHPVAGRADGRRAPAAPDRRAREERSRGLQHAGRGVRALLAHRQPVQAVALAPNVGLPPSGGGRTDVRRRRPPAQARADAGPTAARPRSWR